MNRRQTISLFKKGRSAWNEWAHDLLARRNRMQESGKWVAEETVEGLVPGNDETAKWISLAQASFSTKEKNYAFDAAADFSGFVFPDNAWFIGAKFCKRADFSGARFSRKAMFNESVFEKEAIFDDCRVEGDAWFNEASFLHHTSYDHARFEKVAAFHTAHFKGKVTSFDEATLNLAIFENANCPERISFEHVNFGEDANFAGARFRERTVFFTSAFQGNADFRKCEFFDYAIFENAQFAGEATFNGAKFSGDKSAAIFEQSQFEDEASFSNVIFDSEADFSRITCDGGIFFSQAIFHEGVDFHDSEFNDLVVFDATGFYGRDRFSDVNFSGAKFLQSFNLYGSVFSVPANFVGATFAHVASLDDTTFERLADFTAIRVGHAFLFNGSKFYEVPDFNQANFSEVPRLDNLKLGAEPIWSERWRKIPKRVTKILINRVVKGNPAVPARWRALKRLANLGQDHEREQAFFAKEITSARFATDWPLPVSCPRLTGPTVYWNDPPRKKEPSATEKFASFTRSVLNHIPIVFWRRASWAGFSRFWFGLAYQLLSNFGRSAIRPLVFWLAITALSMLYFLGQNPEVKNAIQKASMDEPHDVITSIQISASAWRAGQQCTAVKAARPSSLEHTNAANEALHLALRNSLVVFGNSDADTFRMYGCLYGVSKERSRAAPLIPSNVAYVSTFQRILAALAIFLIGLSLRNMLRMR